MKMPSKLSICEHCHSVTIAPSKMSTHSGKQWFTNWQCILWCDRGVSQTIRLSACYLHSLMLIACRLFIPLSLFFDSTNTHVPLLIATIGFSAAWELIFGVAFTVLYKPRGVHIAECDTKHIPYTCIAHGCMPKKGRMNKFEIVRFGWIEMSCRWQL